jgi:epoxyqueuosine reductase QueG
MPQPVGQPQYNNVTGAFAYELNVTNPLTTQVSLSQLSAEVVGGNNVTLGTVSAQPISLAPGASAIISIAGNLDQNEIKQLAAQNSGGTNLNVSLENVNVDVGGIKVHFNQLNNVGSIPTG